MITWRLWRALNTRTSLTAVYRRLHLRRGFVEPASTELPALNWLGALVFMVLPVVVIFFGATFLFTAFTSFFENTFLIVSLAVTLYGLAHCIVVSGQIAHEHDVGIYDTLGASLPGLLGLHWAYAARWLFAQRALRWLLLGLVMTGTLAVLLGLTHILPGPESVPIAARSLPPARPVTIPATILLLWLDYGQTIVLGSLVAMLVPAYVPQEVNARLASAATFLGIQIAYAIIFGRFTLLLARLLFGQDAGITPERQIVYLIVIVVFAFTLRESLIRLLWTQLVRRLNAKPSELDALARSRL